MSCPLHLTLNLDERLSYIATLPPSPTHVATSSVARIYVVHQSPKPKQHMPGATHVSVFVTGNEIYMVGRRITSLMVAQDARNKTRGLDRFGPSGGGNTLRPVCGCIIPVLGCLRMCA